MKTVADIMQPVVATAAPGYPLPEIEAMFTKHAISALPVIEGGELVGILSRADVIRQICVERSVSEVIAEHDWDISGFQENPSETETITEVAERLGRRIDHLTARDVMTSRVVSIDPDAAVTEAARSMMKHRIHRLPVLQNGRLLGLISTMDIVCYVAESADEPGI